MFLLETKKIWKCFFESWLGWKYIQNSLKPLNICIIIYKRLFKIPIMLSLSSKPLFGKQMVLEKCVIVYGRVKEDIKLRQRI